MLTGSDITINRRTTYYLNEYKYELNSYYRSPLKGLPCNEMSWHNRQDNGIS